MLRIASWNVDGLAPHLGGEAPPLAAVAARLKDPDVLCLQEIRVRPQDADLIERMRDALPGFDCALALNRDARNATHRGGRMYGVATWTRTTLRVTSRTFDWDREGRLLASIVPSHRLAIVNVYAVNGTGKPYFDHELGRADGDRHAFKRRFVERLAAEAARLRDEGLELVLIGDWNISRTRRDTWPRLRTEEPHATARSEFNDRFLPAAGLVDIWRELHPDERRYTWFNRRARRGLDAARVDFALISDTLAARVAGAGIDDAPEARGRSDHAPLFVAIDR